MKLKMRQYKVTFHLYSYDEADKAISEEVSFEVPAINSKEAEKKASIMGQIACQQRNSASFECVSIEEI